MQNWGLGGHGNVLEDPMFVLFPISQPLTACPWEINFLYTEQSLTHRPILVRALGMQRVREWAWEPLWRSRFILVKNRQARMGRGVGEGCCSPTPAASHLSKMHQKISTRIQTVPRLPYRN